MQDVPTPILAIRPLASNSRPVVPLADYSILADHVVVAILYASVRGSRGCWQVSVSMSSVSVIYTCIDSPERTFFLMR